ncbi:MAG TPA: hypothetical protein V6C64_14605 [Microcoleaceae cyanobacterium]
MAEKWCDRIMGYATAIAKRKTTIAEFPQIYHRHSCFESAPSLLICLQRLHDRIQ